MLFIALSVLLSTAKKDLLVAPDLMAEGWQKFGLLTMLLTRGLRTSGGSAMGSMVH